jgi:hypothetical protein
MLLLHNQRLKPDKEKPDHVWAGRGVGRQLSGKAKRVSTAGNEPITKAQRRSSNLADVFAKPIIKTQRCGGAS